MGFGEWIVLAVLIMVVVLVVRSLWKDHKNSGHCSGNCGSCNKCHGK